ncbi:hypothetical protein ACX0HA_05345 [Flavobacterium hauense]
MKKILLTMAAILVLGIASAQTDPKQVPPAPSTPMPPPKTELKDKPVKDEEIQKDAVNRQPKKQGEIQPRKDELKTQNHVKSTPQPSTLNDTVKPVKKAKRKG